MQLHGKSILDMGCLREGWDLLPKWHCTPEQEVYEPHEGGSPKKKTLTDTDWNFTRIVCRSLCPRRQVINPRLIHLEIDQTTK
jgi:hypothetical protein